MNFDKIDLGTEHKAAIDSCKTLKDQIEELKYIKENPEIILDQVIEDLKNKIDFRREVAKKEIDEKGLELIEDLDNYNKEIKSTIMYNSEFLSSGVNDYLIESVETEIHAWEKELKTFERNVSRWVEIEKEAVKNVEELRKGTQGVRKSLFTAEFDSIVKKQKEFCDEKIETNL